MVRKIEVSHDSRTELIDEYIIWSLENEQTCDPNVSFPHCALTHHVKNKRTNKTYVAPLGSCCHRVLHNVQVIK